MTKTFYIEIIQSYITLIPRVYFLNYVVANSMEKIILRQQLHDFLFHDSSYFSTPVRYKSYFSVTCVKM